jgi:hypothetical protein
VVVNKCAGFVSNRKSVLTTFMNGSDGVSPMVSVHTVAFVNTGNTTGDKIRDSWAVHKSLYYIAIPPLKRTPLIGQ